MNIADVEDAYLAANAEVEVMFAEVMMEFYRPSAQSFVALAAANLRPEQVQMMPDDAKDRIVNFALAK
jgi:hypothetical protein